ncbi:MAG: hypothetical protein IJW92_06510 [Clostridia bacterium]|nr:hypothetical protein [Clostridia bacterium]
MISISELQNTMRDNEMIVRILSEYINDHPRFLTSEMVHELAAECNVTDDEAFRTLFAAACGLDTADNRAHRMLERQYFTPGLHRLDPTPYREDAYAKTVKIPEVSFGKWELCTHSYAPYEPFVCNHPVLTKGFREIPQIGYFAEEYCFPAVLENGIEWMTVTPNEVETMREPIAKSRGNVLTLGLGLGYYAFHATQKAEVTRVVVVEKDPEVISLFKTYILPQFPHKEKLHIVQADAFDYLNRSLKKEEFDFLFADLWHDASDGLDLYLQLKKYEKQAPETEFSYWIEPSLLSVLRQMVFRRITDPNEPLRLRGVSPETLLSDDFLRTLDLKKQN